MIESVIAWSVRNRMLVVLATLLGAVFGIRAMVTVPIDAIPDLSENQVIVFTDWPGRSPREIEDQVTYPLSVGLQGLAGVKAVRSSSEFNFSMINVIFEDSIDFYFARQRVQERLSTLGTQLPPGVVPYMAPDATALGQIFWYTVEGEDTDLGELRAIQDWFVRYQLASVPGVAEVASVGGAPREYQIDLDPTKLRGFGITLGEVDTAVTRSSVAAGGRVIQKGNAEYLVRAVGWIESVEDLQETVVAQRGGTPIRLRDVAAVQLGPGLKRSVLEKDGREVVGGVVLMRHGENPLDVTRRIKEKIQALQAGLPEGVRIEPFYDRTPLIHSAIDTISHTVIEEIIVCSIAIFLILGHARGALIVSSTLPLSILFSFLLMKWFGISSNIMSMAGIAISVGILVDQAIVMTENAAHHLTQHYGPNKIAGDIRPVVIAACQTVGRPVFFAVLITILSFLPVFALTGMEGKMFHPLAWTKTFALIGVAILSITFVPAVISFLLKGRIKTEEQSWLIRSMTAVYRPMLSWLLGRPMIVTWLFVVIVGLGWIASRKVGHEFMPKLNEGTLLEMPTSVPRMSVTQVTQDLKFRDAVLRSLPEIGIVVGKAGRADTATDPAPLDMIETIINLRGRADWPKRKMRYDDAVRQAEAALAALEAGGHVGPVPAAEREGLINDAAMTVSAKVDEALRAQAKAALDEHAPIAARAMTAEAIRTILDRVDPRHKLAAEPDPKPLDELAGELAATYGHRLWEEVELDVAEALVREAGRGLMKRGVLHEGADVLTPPAPFWAPLAETVGIAPTSLTDTVRERMRHVRDERTRERIAALNWELFDRAVAVATEAALAEVPRIAESRTIPTKAADAEQAKALAASLAKPFSDKLLLWKKTQDDLIEELNGLLQMPGWGNIFTQPIINRIDMLATGVRTQVGVKVFGDDLDTIQRVSQEVAAAIKTVRGAADVVPDQIVGKGYVDIRLDRTKAARYGIAVVDVQDAIEVALGGKPLALTVDGRRRYPIRIRYARDFRQDEAAIKDLLLTARGPLTPGGMMEAAPIRLGDVAEVKVSEGPAMIKGENGLLRAYVQLNVRNRDALGFVEEARRVVAERVKLPPGMYIEWAGEFEHQVRARKTLALVFPAVLAVIALILYLTYNSVAECLLVMTSVLGALAGGAMFQWLMGVNTSVAVQVGFIACFGMAVETGVVMLVYLREAVTARGGLDNIGSVEELREAILEGAVHRLRPKLLTEGTAILSIAPMLWSTGVGAEMIRPMATPVLGGLLIADEVIDVFLPVLYFALMKRRFLKRRRANQAATPAAAPASGHLAAATY